MRLRSSLLASAVLILSALILTLVAVRPTAGQGGGAEQGRYVMRIADHNNQIVVFDTWNGHSWTHTLGGGRGWVDLGRPTVAR